MDRAVVEYTARELDRDYDIEAVWEMYAGTSSVNIYDTIAVCRHNAHKALREALKAEKVNKPKVDRNDY